ncbi:MAG: hypothetical protein GX923_07775 [Clostridia bacterium]|jgi:hypothetical protein|nr:hypothetical protein [Clostridia bacterium]
MSLKAIDGQVMLQKVNEVSRLQKLEQQQGQQLQENAMLQTKKDAQKDETSVNKLNYTEQNRINNQEKNEQKDKRNPQGEGKNKTNKINNPEEDDLNLEKHLGSVFDLRI